MKNLRDNPLSICFIGPKAYGLFDPSVKTGFGGAEVDLYMLATELAKDSTISISFITADYGQPAEQIIENVRLLKSLDFRRPACIGAIWIWAALKKADSQFYLIKTASLGVPLVSSFCRFYRRRFLYRTAHRHECDGTYQKEHLIAGQLFNRALRKATCVFVQNRDDGNELLKTAGVTSIFIPNGHRIEPAPDTQRDNILWVGRSAAFKQPRRFLELASRFPNEKFVMICRPATGDTEYPKLQKQAAEIPNLTFYTEVNFTEMDRFFATAKIFINTSDAEGFPNTFIQAARTATPILTWQINPDQFLTRHQCGLACGGSMEKLSQGLTFLLENQRYIELGQNGLNYVRQHHDIATIANRYKEILRQIVKAGSAESQ